MVMIKGVQPNFFVKLDFEIAVDQKEGTYDQTFEGVWTPNAEYCTQGGHSWFWLKNIKFAEQGQN